MPVETLRPSDGRLAGVPFTSAMPFRILNKGPGYFRPSVEPGTRKLSAVERLEADKAKYVKSQQVALTRQAPIQPPIRKPLLPPAMMPQSHINAPLARKVPRCPADAENSGGRDRAGERRPAFSLDILNNLIGDVCDGTQSSLSTSPSSSSPSSGVKSICSSLSAEQDKSKRVLNNLKPLNHGTNSCSSSSSSPLSNDPRAPVTELTRRPPPVTELTRRPPPVPARAPRGVLAPHGAPSSVTVRRVDVRPHAEVKKPQRSQLQLPLRPRQTAQGQVPHSQVPPPPPPSQKRPQLPHKVNTSSQTQPPPPAYLPASPLLVRARMIPPASPAFTRISNASSKASSRKHPTLHRSKSDLSDRYSRATADLERFFNYCGLDPGEVEGMGGVERFTRANSDIVSVSKLRSVSTSSSECGDDAERRRGRGGDEDDEDGPLRASERVPYGISIIERNARVIKWLYGIRQARDANSAVSNV